MNPLRWDVLVVGLLLAVPVLGLGVRGDFAVQEVLARLPWCLVAGWLVVSVIRFAGSPHTKPEPGATDAPEPESSAPDAEPATT
jgi:hypothetical protein